MITESILEKFQTIYKIVGGPKEIARAEDLLKCVTVVPDDPSERVKKFIGHPRLKTQHLLCFGTGIFWSVLLIPINLAADKRRATVMTSNGNFVRCAQEVGLHFSVFMHPARALTEQKSEPSNLILNSEGNRE